MDNKKKEAAIAFYPSMIKNELTCANSLVKGLKDLEKSYDTRAKSNTLATNLQQIGRDASKNIQSMWTECSDTML